MSVIHIKSCLTGAESARGLTVVIDVFRFSNTALALLSRGARYLIPVQELDKAYRLKKEHPEYLLVGERKGLPPPGFDLGNSPAEALFFDLTGKIAIVTTSAGTRGLLAASKAADEVIIGSFANIKAVVNYINKREPRVITLVPMGFEGTEKAEEDELCAEYIRNVLEGNSPSFAQIRKKLLETAGAERLRSLGQIEDLDLCTQLNIFNLIPKVKKISEISSNPFFVVKSVSGDQYTKNHQIPPGI